MRTVCIYSQFQSAEPEASTEAVWIFLGDDRHTNAIKEASPLLIWGLSNPQPPHRTLGTDREAGRQEPSNSGQLAACQSAKSWSSSSFCVKTRRWRDRRRRKAMWLGSRWAPGRMASRSPTSRRRRRPTVENSRAPSSTAAIAMVRASPNIPLLLIICLLESSSLLQESTEGTKKIEACCWSSCFHLFIQMLPAQRRQRPPIGQRAINNNKQPAGRETGSLRASKNTVISLI